MCASTFKALVFVCTCVKLCVYVREKQRAMIVFAMCSHIYIYSLCLRVEKLPPPHTYNYHRLPHIYNYHHHICTITTYTTTTQLSLHSVSCTSVSGYLRQSTAQYTLHKCSPSTPFSSLQNICSMADNVYKQFLTLLQLWRLGDCYSPIANC